MKNSNMVRTYGHKNLYFYDIKMVARFVNLYKDLFVHGDFKVIKMNIGKKEVYKLTFLMNHDMMNEIRNSIKIVKKSCESRYGKRSQVEFVI